jgi:RNA polymerase sigma factor for flagellar operon FliA
VAVNDSDPEERAERNQLKAQLVDALKWLPLKEQQVMAMHYDHDMSFREIGETMGLTAARACQLHTLAVHRIRASLGERSEVGNV